MSAVPGEVQEAFDHASYHFWWGVGDSKLAFDDLLDKTKAALNLINSSDLHRVYAVLLDLKQEDAATALLNQFIAANRDRPGALALSDHFGDNYDATFKAALEAEVARVEEPQDLALALDAINFHLSWNPEDITTITNAKFDDVLLLLIGAKEHRLFARRLTTLLKIGERNDSTKEERKLRENTIEWLKKFAAADPLSALRVRRFLPSEPSDQSTSAT